MGHNQKICNSNKSVCLDVADIVNTKDNYGISSTNKAAKNMASRLTTWGEVPGWRSNWDISSDGQKWSEIKFTKL